MTKPPPAVNKALLASIIIIIAGYVQLSFLYSPPRAAAEKVGQSNVTPTPTQTPTPAPLPPAPPSYGKQTAVDDELTAEQARDFLLGGDDADCDGIKNASDNCPITYNPDQKDADRDGIGDACDAGSTSSYRVDRRCNTPYVVVTPDPDDVMPVFKEPGAEDYLDGGLGSKDIDCDGVRNSQDNCIFIYNPDQKDKNKDGVGDVCSTRTSGFTERDQLCGVADPSPTASPTIPTVAPEELSLRSVSVLDPDGDFDCDGILNSADNCMWVYNPDQKDNDGNGIGDVCIDPQKKDVRCDRDLDGINDLDDNCSSVCNPDQKDANKNGLGDACERTPSFTYKVTPCRKKHKLKVLPTLGKH